MPTNPTVKIILRCPWCDRWHKVTRQTCRGTNTKTGNQTGCGQRLTKNGMRFWWLLWYETPGRPTRLRIGWSGNAQAAQAKQQEIQTQLTEGRAFGKSNRLTVEDFFADYIKKHVSKKKSAKQDINYINRLLLPAWHGKKLLSIEKPDVVDVFDNYAETAPIGANRLLSVISHAFNWAIERGLLTNNPTRGINKIEEKPRDRVLTEAEIQWLWEKTVGSSAAGQILRMILVTAQRPGEVGGMMFEDIDLEKKIWEIPEPKKKVGHRVPLTGMALEIILSRSRKEKGLVFSSRKGRPIKTYGRIIDSVDFVPHDLRRTAATMLSALGKSDMVGRILNHVRPAVTGTYNRYTYDDEKLEALEVWERRLGAIISNECQSAGC